MTDICDKQEERGEDLVYEEDAMEDVLRGSVTGGEAIEETRVAAF